MPDEKIALIPTKCFSPILATKMDSNLMSMTVPNTITGPETSKNEACLDIDSVLDRLKVGFIFNMIGPQFRVGLLKRLEIRNKEFFQDSKDKLLVSPLLALTMAAYREPVEPSLLNVGGPENFIVQAIRESENQVWNSILKAIDVEATYLVPNKVEVKRLNEAIRIIQSTAPVAFESFEAWITHVCGIRSEKFRSVSHPHFFGCIFVAPNRDPADLAISIIHELAHQEFFLINVVDRLVNIGFDYHEIHAPFQGRKRPPIGRFHAAHALYRMVQFESALGHSNTEKHIDLLKKTIDTFERGELTSFSWRLVNEVYRDSHVGSFGNNSFRHLGNGR